MARRTFPIVLIKPSHYDEDGYVIQWWRSTIPSNSLASVHGLLAVCAEERALGPDVDIEIDAYDECNTVIDVGATARRIKNAGAFVMLIPKELDPVAAGRDMPLPPERPSAFSSLSLTTMADPTAVDTPDNDPPAADAKPALAPAPAPKASGKARHKK